MLVIIVVQSKINEQWGYCPKGARHMLRPEQDENAPYPTVKDALNAIRRDKTIPRDHEVEVEQPSPQDMADAGFPFLAAMMRGVQAMDPEATQPNPRLDPMTCWPFPRSES